VRAEANWIEVTDWRGQNGLDPMAVRGAKVKERCPGRQAACELVGRYGRWRITPLPVPVVIEPDAASLAGATETSPVAGAAFGVSVGPAENEEAASTKGRRTAKPKRAPGASRPKFDPCPTKAELVFTPIGGSDVTFNPCIIGATGGAVIEVRDGHAKARFGESDAGRPWGRQSR